jgi:hypothetical protein
MSFWCYLIDRGNPDCYNPDKPPVPQPDFLPRPTRPHCTSTCIVRKLVVGAGEHGVAHGAINSGIGKAVLSGLQCSAHVAERTIGRTLILLDAGSIIRCYNDCNPAESGDGLGPYIGYPHFRLGKR